VPVRIFNGLKVMLPVSFQGFPKRALPSMTALLLVIGCGQGADIPFQEGSVTLPDFRGINDADERKRRFFEFLRPLIEAENAKILNQRRRLLQLHEKHREKMMILWAEMEWLMGILKEYEVEGLVVGELSHWDNLLRRVDMIPVDLALIQAAKESGWGTSRFALEGNNLFGERCFTEGCGIVPNERESGAGHEVRTFESAGDSVRSYIHNLNTNGAYRRLRRLRFQQRLEGREPEGYGLVDGLPQYSERRYLYLNEIRAMMRSNRGFLDS
jgi:Bax protein